MKQKDWWSVVAVPSSPAESALVVTLITAAAVALRWGLDPWLGDHLAFVTLFAAVALVAARAGWRAACVCMVAGFLACSYLFVEPRGSLWDSHAPQVAGSVAFLLSGLVVISCGELLRSARQQVRDEQADQQVTLRSIGDGVLTTDAQGRITDANLQAELLTGWTRREALGRPMEDVLRLLDEDTGEAVEAPSSRALREDRSVTPEAPRVLLARDGTRRLIDDSATPVRDEGGAVRGCVVVFRDIGEQGDIQRALQRSERDLADFFENANVGLHWVGPDGTILRANQAELDMLGYDEDEYVGRNITEFHADAGVIEDILARLAAGEVLSGVPARMLHHDGTLRDVLINSSVLFEGGEFVHTRCFTLDITEVQRAQDRLVESEQRFRELANNIDQMAWTCDELGRATWFNDRWYEFTGKTPENSSDANWQELHHPDHIERVRAGLKCCAEAGIAWEDTFPLRGRDGRYRWFLSRATPIRDEHERIVCWFGTNTDVTEMRRMEQVLREEDRRKDEFLAILAHEMRNPLAPIRNAIEILLNAPETLGEEQTHWAHGVIDRQVRQLSRLLDDLLDMSRITHGKFDLQRERVDIEQVIRSAVESSQPAIAAAGLEFELVLPAVPVHVEADPLRLAQVFSNLLGNAAKYTDAGGHLRLEVARHESDVRVSVCDDGIGVPPEELAGMFDLFVQDPRSRTRSQGGLGIGLTLARGIVELHGGRIEACSDGPGKGSEFIVTLPVAADQHDAPAPELRAATAGSDHSGVRVLVADDHQVSADSLCILLERMGLDTRAAYDGQSAVDAARTFRPQVVLLDIGMPVLDGHQACRRIRDLPGGPAMLIVAITGWGQAEDVRKSSRAGFDHHMVKPVDHQELIGWIDTRMQKARNA